MIRIRKYFILRLEYDLFCSTIYKSAITYNACRSICTVIAITWKIYWATLLVKYIWVIKIIRCLCYIIKNIGSALTYNVLFIWGIRWWRNIHLLSSRFIIIAHTSPCWINSEWIRGIWFSICLTCNHILTAIIWVCWWYWKYTCLIYWQINFTTTLLNSF